jgi:hypothetical protein
VASEFSWTKGKGERGGAMGPGSYVVAWIKLQKHPWLSRFLCRFLDFFDFLPSDPRDKDRSLGFRCLI